ncbi:MAG: hypothetical protein HYX22_02255 [Candidatus Yanofskybacteria bacterium]|nr:hypothetical protein [Candidatus Yanofskybacteria bacterium]
MLRPILLAMLFIFMIGPSVFAQTPKPKILKMSEIQFNTPAVGFSVFRGVEPERFEVKIKHVTDIEGFPIILARISGGPMETPLEKIGAVEAMSGSPIFVGCVELEECVRKVVLPDNDVFLVGALSYALGYFIEDGPNVGLTTAEYMLGARLGGYAATRQFSIRPPNKIIVDGREFKNLMLFSGIDGLQTRGALPDGSCGESVQSDIGPGSMVTVFLARGSRNIGGSGTVTWRDGNTIYIFGHPFFGTGAVSYPFAQVSVADTLQTPFQAHKIIGCRLKTEGEMQMDGMFEMAGVIGRSARLLPFQVEIGDDLAVFSEEIAESPLASLIISQLPVVWAQSFLGDLSQVSAIYQTRIAVTDHPEIFLSGLSPAQVVKNPFAGIFSEINPVLGKLRDSGFRYNLEGIKTHIDLARGASVWTEKRSFLSQNTAKPGETVYVNIVLEERSRGLRRQVSIPVKVPDDFNDRLTSGIPPQFSVIVQSADKFVDKNASKEFASLRDVIEAINESAARWQNVLYVQQIMPLTKAKHEAVEEAAKLSVQPDWSWVELDQGAMSRLPKTEETEIILTSTPGLAHFISFDATFKILVKSSDTASGGSVKKNKRWFDYLKVWRIF